MRVSITSVFAALALSASAAAQFQFKNQYPAAGSVAPTDTDLVKQWLAAINMSSVPDLPLIKADSQGNPVAPSGGPPAGACYWTYDLCTDGDITVCPNKGDWGLTYDDGPTQYSTALYDFLDKSNQKATLFYIGANVVANPALAQRACTSGHHIAVHTWSHHALTTLTNEQIVAEVKYTELAIKEVCNVTTRYIRPPYGDVDNRVRALFKQMGYINVIWDIDTDDWSLPPGGSNTPAAVDKLFTQWIAGKDNLTAGHICLEHDLYQASVDAAIRNLPNIQAAFKVQTVAQCLGDTHPYVENVSLGINSTNTTNTTANATSSVLPTSVQIVTVTPTPSQDGAKTTGTTSGVSSMMYSTTLVFLSAITGALFMTL